MSIHKQLLFYFTLLSAIGGTLFVVLWLYGFPAIGVEGMYASEYRRALISVEAIATKQRDELESWFEDKRHNMSLLANNESFSSTVAQVARAPRNGADARQLHLERWLQQLKEISPNSFNYIYLFDPKKGRILASTESGWAMPPEAHREKLAEAIQPGLSEFVYVVEESYGPSILVTQQVLGRDNDGMPDGTLPAVLVASMPLQTPVSKEEVNLKPYLGDSGMLLLFGRDRRLLVSNVNAASFDISPYATAVVPGAEGVKLLELSGRKEVMMAFRHVNLGASDGLSLVAVRSSDDALASISANFLRMGGLMLVIFLLAMGLTVFAAQRLRSQDLKLRNMAFYDVLTKLPNRRLLLERLRSSMLSADSTNYYGAILFLDMDKFKDLNDTLGHSYGDLLLIEVGCRLQSCVRERDTVARLGGDEFVVLCANIDRNEEEATKKIVLIAEKIRVSLSQPYMLREREYHCSPSIGVSLFHDSTVTDEELLKNADIAMYQAKESGRNAVRFFDPDMQQVVNNRATLEAALRHVISERQLHLYYQVQVNSDLHPIGAEALVRWIHPERGMISPLQFIPIAEESSLILEIGNWVLESACRQLSVWAQSEYSSTLTLAVNVSAKQFKQTDFVERVVHTMQAHGVTPSRLKLELTESVVLNDIVDMVNKMHALKRLGVRLSMDDFGTGYSSLSYLKQLPIDQLKIDQSFVRDITVDQNDAMMVQTIIDMAKNFRLNVIAEGVETEAQLAFLQAHGCMAYQGYLFSKPLPLEQFDAFIKNRCA